MNKKLIIQIVLIIFCFGASGLVLYSGLIKNQAPGNLPDFLSAGKPSGAATREKILPHGNKMNFDVLTDYNLQFGEQLYPTLNYESEVGVDEDKLLRQFLPTKK